MATTIDDIIQGGKELANVEKSNFFSSTELFRVANDAIRYVYEMLVTSFPDSYFANSATFTITTNPFIQLSDILPGGTQMFKETGITKIDSGCLQTVPPLGGFADRNNVTERRFWIAGGAISFYPQSPGWSHAGQYSLDYTQDFVDLTTGQAIPTELQRWRELIQTVMAVQLMSKRRKDATDLITRQQALEAKITLAASSRKQEPRKFRTDRRFERIPGERFKRWC